MTVESAVEIMRLTDGLVHDFNGKAEHCSDCLVCEIDNKLNALQKENDELKARIEKQNSKIECADCGSLLARF
jgi:hypothetical protein